MLAQELHFLGRQALRSLQHVSRYQGLADIAQQPGQACQRHLRLGENQLPGERLHQCAQRDRVPHGVVVPALEPRHGQEHAIGRFQLAARVVDQLVSKREQQRLAQPCGFEQTVHAGSTLIAHGTHARHHHYHVLLSVHTARRARRGHAGRSCAAAFMHQGASGWRRRSTVCMTGPAVADKRVLGMAVSFGFIGGYPGSHFTPDGGAREVRTRSHRPTQTLIPRIGGAGLPTASL